MDKPKTYQEAWDAFEVNQIELGNLQRQLNAASERIAEADCERERLTACLASLESQLDSNRAATEAAERKIDEANKRVSTLITTLHAAVDQREETKRRAEAAERKLATRLADNNRWWGKRFDYIHRWAKTLPEPHITEFFDIAANGQVAEWRDRYTAITAQIEQPHA